MTPDASPRPGKRGAIVDYSTLLYRNVVESMDGGVMAIDSDGRIGLFNTGASQLLGLERTQVQGKAFGEVFLSLEGLEAFSDAVLAAVYDKEVGNRTTVGVRLEDGTERALAVTTVYLVDRTGEETRPSGIVAVFDDVTEIEALRRAEELFAEATEKQNVELREAYRQLDENNQALGSALKKVQAIRMVAIVLVATLFAGAAWFVWDEAGSGLLEGLSEASGPTPDAGKPAHTMTVSPQPFTLTLAFVGRLGPREEVLVTSPTSGKVARMHFEYGARVVAGQPLIELDTAKAERQHRTAQAELLEARDQVRVLERWEQSPEITRLRRTVARAERELEAQRSKVAETALLLEQGIIPEQEHRAAERQYDGAEMSYDAGVQDLALALEKGGEDALQIARLRLENAQAAVRDLEKTLASATIMAPVSGVVLQTRDRQGRAREGGGEPLKLSPGLPVNESGFLVAIGDLGGLSVTGRIDEVDVVKVRPGQPVRISGDAFPGLELHGSIAQISAESRTTGGSRVPTFDVTADVEPPGDEDLDRLRLGMTANVTVVVREEPAALLVPIVAVHGRTGAFWVNVWDEENETSRRVPVEVGATTRHRAEIVHGIEPGDEVIVSG